MVRAVLLLFALCLSVSAQQRALLGKADANSANKITLRHRISYNAHGFDRSRAKAAEKSKRYLTNKGAGHLTNQLDEFESLVSIPSQIPEWIDSAFDDRHSAFIACGGKWADTARKFNPRSLHIEVMSGAWTWNNILVGGLTEGRSIKAAILTIGGVADMRSAYLNKFDAYARYEIGNALGFAAGEMREIGVSSPCQ